MMLAQATPDASTWAVISGMGTMIFVQLGKWLTDYRKDRRDREEATTKADLERDKQATLYRIASATEDSEKANIKRHGEILLALSGACIVKQNKLKD